MRHAGLRAESANSRKEIEMTDHTVADKREFFRFNCDKPLQFRILSTPKDGKPVSRMIDGSSKNLSASGILFTSSVIPEISSILKLELDYRTTNICREIDENALVVGNTLIGKVVRIEDNNDGRYNVGVAFIKKLGELPEEIKSLIL